MIFFSGQRGSGDTNYHCQWTDVLRHAASTNANGDNRWAGGHLHPGLCAACPHSSCRHSADTDCWQPGHLHSSRPDHPGTEYHPECAGSGAGEARHTHTPAAGQCLAGCSVWCIMSVLAFFRDLCINEVFYESCMAIYESLNVVYKCEVSSASQLQWGVSGRQALPVLRDSRPPQPRLHRLARWQHK